MLARIKKAQEIVARERIELLLQNDQVTQFYIIGQNRDYLVTCNRNGSWWCSCDDHQHRHSVCKHIIGCILKIEGDLNGHIEKV